MGNNNYDSDQGLRSRRAVRGQLLTRHEHTHTHTHNQRSLRQCVVTWLVHCADKAHVPMAAWTA